MTTVAYEEWRNTVVRYNFYGLQIPIEYNKAVISEDRKTLLLAFRDAKIISIYNVPGVYENIQDNLRIQHPRTHTAPNEKTIIDGIIYDRLGSIIFKNLVFGLTNLPKDEIESRLLVIAKFTKNDILKRVTMYHIGDEVLSSKYIDFIRFFAKCSYLDMFTDDELMYVYNHGFNKKVEQLVEM
jgi:hypothetical protein